MSRVLLLLALLSVAGSLLGYWRASRLHLRILDIEPHFRTRACRLVERFICKGRHR